MTREELNNIDLDNLLHGLTGVVYDTCKIYLKQIHYNRVKDERCLTFIAPVVRNIICMILETESQNVLIKSNSELIPGVLEQVNVNDIIDRFETTYSQLFPKLTEYSNIMDVEMEIVHAFCEKYIKSLIANVEKTKQVETLEDFLIDNKFRLDTYYGTNKRYVKEITDLQNLYVRIYSDVNKIVDVEYESIEVSKHDKYNIVSFETIETIEQLKHLIKALVIIKK